MAKKTKRKRPSARARRPRGKCLTCEGQAKWRGLCIDCYNAAIGSIRRGKHSEEELIEKNLILPRRQGRVNAWSIRAEEVLEK